MSETMNDTITQRELVSEGQVTSLFHNAQACFPGVFGKITLLQFVREHLLDEVERRIETKRLEGGPRDVGDVLWLASLLIIEESMLYRQVATSRPVLQDWEREARNRPILKATIEDLTETAQEGEL